MASVGLEIREATQQSDAATADLLVHIPPPQQGEVAPVVDLLRQAAASMGGSSLSVVLSFATGDGRLAASDASAGAGHKDWLRIGPYLSNAQRSALPGVHTSADYVAALAAAKASGARVCLMLGPEAKDISAQGIAALAAPALDGSADLVMPLYSLAPYEGLLNKAVLYPLTRSLFGGRVRYPLGFDLAMSQTMQQRMLALAGRSQDAAESYLWPSSEALIAGLGIAQADLGPRPLPHVDGADLTSIISSVLGSLFGDAEAKAAQWQRVRKQPQGAEASTEQQASTGTGSAPEAAGMVESFRLGAANLQEIWGIVLPPNTLLALRKLARSPAAEFRLDDALWARIVYDFMIAYRLRAISRSHLLGAFVPLYLGWVASYVLETANTRFQAPQAERRAEALAEVFEADKSYLLARWRWPDRFNP